MYTTDCQNCLRPCSAQMLVPRPCRTEKDVVQTPSCRRSNRVLVRQFSARNFVYCIAGRLEEKALELTTSCSDQCPCPGTVPEYSSTVLPLEVLHVHGHGQPRSQGASGTSREETLGTRLGQRCPDSCSSTDEKLCSDKWQRPRTGHELLV